MTRLVISFIFIIFFFQPSYAEQIKVFEFTEKEFSELEVKKVKWMEMVSMKKQEL
jgi:hypothetical protein